MFPSIRNTVSLKSDVTYTLTYSCIAGEPRGPRHPVISCGPRDLGKKDAFEFVFFINIYLFESVIQLFVNFWQSISNRVCELTYVCVGHFKVYSHISIPYK